MILNTMTQVPWIQWVGAIVIAATEDYNQAKKMMLRSAPGFNDRMEWAGLIGEYQSDACVMAWVFMRTGDELLDRDLVNLWC